MNTMEYPACKSTENETYVTGSLPVVSFTKEVNPWLSKCPLKTNRHLANFKLTSLVKEATWVLPDNVKY